MGFSPILTEGTVLAHGVSMSGNAVRRKCCEESRHDGN
jgi:hypothetical protein